MHSSSLCRIKFLRQCNDLAGLARRDNFLLTVHSCININSHSDQSFKSLFLHPFTLDGDLPHLPSSQLLGLTLSCLPALDAKPPDALFEASVAESQWADTEFVYAIKCFIDFLSMSLFAIENKYYSPACIVITVNKKYKYWEYYGYFIWQLSKQLPLINMILKIGSRSIIQQAHVMITKHFPMCFSLFKDYSK